MHTRKVYVYPDGEQYSTPPPWKSDDYIERETADCLTCGEELQVEYDGPFATCLCGTGEWYK